MPDMLVRLYQLPEVKPTLDALKAEGIEVRRTTAPEKHIVVDWVRQHFSAGWASETDVSYTNHPPSCWIATQGQTLLGFACYNSTAKGYFGPTGVDESQRGRGIGKALLLVCLHDMWAQGYGYCIINAAGPVDFYSKAVGAVVIPDSSPGFLRGMLWLGEAAPGLSEDAPE